MENEEPYIREELIQIIVTHKYNPKYGNDRMCECGHPYHRHFDPYEKWDAVGCKYCGCWKFEERTDESVLKYKDITVGFEFEFYGEKLRVVSDYETTDKNKPFVQAEKTDTLNKSSRQYTKKEILDYLRHNEK